LRSDFEEDEDEEEEEVAKQALQNTTYIRLTGECMYVITYVRTYIRIMYVYSSSQSQVVLFLCFSEYIYIFNPDLF
jgi:hypothetical protein